MRDIIEMLVGVRSLARGDLIGLSRVRQQKHG